MLLEEISLHFCRLLQRNVLIDLLLSSTLHHDVTFVERNHFVADNVQNVLLSSLVYEIWLGQNSCKMRMKTHLAPLHITNNTNRQLNIKKNNNQYIQKYQTSLSNQFINPIFIIYSKTIHPQQSAV